MKRNNIAFGLSVVLSILCSSCTYNPFIANNHLTGNPAATAAGAGIGAGTIALFGGSRPLILLGGLGGAAIGYYATTLRFDAGGIISQGGQVYQTGKYLGIYIPADSLFEVNTADFLPQAPRILDSVVAVLNRAPNNNIMISGNTSGFGRSRYELRLSEQRAKAITEYLNQAGISIFKENSTNMRKLSYTGFGDFFPIAHQNDYRAFRENNYIQITSYPTRGSLLMDRRSASVAEPGNPDDSYLFTAPIERECDSSGLQGNCR